MTIYQKKHKPLKSGNRSRFVSPPPIIPLYLECQVIFRLLSEGLSYEKALSKVYKMCIWSGHPSIADLDKAVKNILQPIDAIETI